MAEMDEAAAPIRMITLYRSPDDEARFLAHYEHVHAPLLKAIPHLRDLNVARVSHGSAGEPGYFLMAEMMFEDRTRIAQAMCSRENRRVVSNVPVFAPKLVTRMVVET